MTPVGDLAGVARHVRDVARVGIPGWRVIVLAPPGALVDALRADGVAVLAAPFGPAHGTVTSVRSLRRAIGHVRPDIVHSHLAFADMASALATSTGGPRLVSTEHGIAAEDGVYHASSVGARAMAGAHRIRQHRLHGSIAVSRATRAAMDAKWGTPRRLVTDVIPNGIDRRPRPTRTPGLHIGSLSRLAPEKGLEHLIDAFAGIAQTHPEAHLTLGGEGPLRDALAQQVAHLALAHRVSLPGYVEADDLLPELDVVAQLSVWENCSYTLLEAMRAGCGVVATAVGGNPELLPSRCLVERGATSALASRLVAQGTDLQARPLPAPGWPTVEAMCQAIAAHYSRVCP